MVKVRYKQLSKELKNLLESGTGDNIRASTSTGSQVGEFYYLPIEKLIPYKNQARQKFNDKELEELAQTIKEHGVLQPLTVVPSSLEENFYEVISGERRLRAALSVGLTQVPCIILKDQAAADEVALIENIQRADLHPVELASAYQKILSKMAYGGMSQLASKVGRTVSTISETSKLDTLPPEIKKHLVLNNVRSKIIFRKLLSMPSEVEMRLYLGIDKNIDHKSSKSVLRVSLMGDDFNVETNAFKKLTHSQRGELKKLLLSIAENI